MRASKPPVKAVYEGFYDVFSSWTPMFFGHEDLVSCPTDMRKNLPGQEPRKRTLHAIREE
jgi:hypothetical protein